MTGDDDTRAMALEMAQALSLVRAGHTLYADILAAVKETVGRDGNADIPVLVKRLVGRAAAGDVEDWKTTTFIAALRQRGDHHLRATRHGGPQPARQVRLTYVSR